MRVLNAIANALWLMPAAYVRAFYAIASRDQASIAEEIRARYDARKRGEGPHAVIANAGERLDGTCNVMYRDGVAIVPVIGPIFRYADWFTDISGATTLDDIAKGYAVAMSSPRVRDILFYIDSPGGEATGIHEFAQTILRPGADAGRKRHTAYGAGLIASASYWIGSACSEIVVDRTAMGPSIGVVFAVPNPATELYRDIEIVSTQSPKKRLDVTTAEGHQEIQQWADDLADVFISSVASNRDVSEDVVTSEAWGAGSMVVGEKLVSAGIADRIGSFEQVVGELVSSRMSGAQISA